ncbi:TetR/AcrR family transcriptional regulator [Nocardioides sp.]|uniref:TetR/AcrR family transcriptional regulator n=1 Tax=Nocardioides sp. TaxID=35761 RepID=UPI0039E26480
MTQSAIDERRARTRHAITLCAQQLTDERGLDGFTMDELAECAGISRRTLFNYVPSKVDAVLGPMPDPEPELFETFMAGGPTGHLMSDVKELVVDVLRTKDADPTDIERTRRIIEADARLHHAIHERFVRITGLFTDAILQREGTGFDSAKARIAATFTLALFDTALDSFIADPATPMDRHYARAFDIAVELFD